MCIQNSRNLTCMLRFKLSRGYFRAFGNLPGIRGEDHTKILAFETSCDDTAVSILRGDGKILSDIRKNQNDLVARYGGVVPSLAARKHRETLPYLIEKCLSEADLKADQINLIAATRGPGIASCLNVGFDAGRILAKALGKPFYSINHIESHLLSPRIFRRDIAFPFIGLVVSGGHTLLVFAKGLGEYTILGTTIDDSVGEIIDKSAKYLGLDYDNDCGPAEALCRKAAKGNIKQEAFECLIKSLKLINSFDFSFSGIKTKLRNMCENNPLSEQDKCDLSLALLDACAIQIADQLKKAINFLELEFKSPSLPVLISGGVVKNSILISRIQHHTGLDDKSLVMCSPNLCTDNAVMIAWTLLEYVRANKSMTSFDHVDQNWPISELKLS